MNKIFVTGSVNIDLVIQTARIPKLGETVSGSGFSTICGGKGANQAIAAAKCGGDVTMLASVGDDLYGNMALSNLNRAGVCTKHIKTVKHTPTGVAVITVCGGDNHIILDAGAAGTHRGGNAHNVARSNRGGKRCAKRAKTGNLAVAALFIFYHKLQGFWQMQHLKQPQSNG